MNRKHCEEMGRRSRGGRRAGALRRVVTAAAVLVLVSCFEEPVAERMELAFHPDGSFEVRIETTITDRDTRGNPALARRLADLRRSLEQSSDPWSRRFELLMPAFERLVQEREEGALVRVERSARSADHEALERFFADAGVTAQVDRYERELTLQLVPGGSLRASRSQRARVHELLSTWSEAVARTYSATRDLYGFLAEHPDRARICLSVLFGETLPAAEQYPDRELDDTDRPLVEAVLEARQEVVAIFEVPDDEPYSLNELSHLVYDPFPARLTVRLPSEPLAVEGFEQGQDGELAVSGLGLYEALQALGEVWARPDPLVTYVEAARSRGEARLSLDELVQTPLMATGPDQDEVRQALEVRLRPAPVYRVDFRLPDGKRESGAVSSGPTNDP